LAKGASFTAQPVLVIMEGENILNPFREALKEVHKSPSAVNKCLYDKGATSLVIFAVIALMDQVLGRDMRPINFLPCFEPTDIKNLCGFTDVSCML